MWKLYVFLIIACCACDAQTDERSMQRVGGPFENADFIYIDMPSKISSIDTSLGWDLEGQKLFISGTIFKKDGKSPAKDVVLYYYHTNVQGVYENRPGLNPKVKRHGYIRGWVKTDKNGKYGIYTVRPGSYPNREITAHIHLTVKEPNSINEYYIDAIVFDDDPYLDEKERSKLSNRGGTGIVKLEKNGITYSANRDITLGKNIADY